MNSYIMLVPVTILILAGTGVVSQAFAATVITIETDKDVYDHASTIILTGNVDPVDLRGSEVTIMCKSPGGTGVCGIYQLSVNSDGNFSVSINTATFLMKKDGIYEFQANYSGLADATVSVELTNAIETSETGTAVIGTAVTGTGEAETGEAGTDEGSFYKLAPGQIEYDITCNASPAFFANADDDSIVILLDATDDGILTITLHEELIKPFDDGTFVVIVDNQEMQDFTQIGNTLTIPCVAGTEKIEIHGSWAIPEFGVIAAMILAVAIVSIIVVTAKTRLSLVPRY
jgi:predicted secreted protein with PEFG-CTERM motif